MHIKIIEVKLLVEKICAFVHIFGIKRENEFFNIDLYVYFTNMNNVLQLFGNFEKTDSM